MSVFSKRFKHLRESRGMTQDKAAEVLGISRSTIAGYESEDKNRIPREETLTKIADLFGTSIDYLLGRDKKDEIPKEETEMERMKREIAEITYKAKNEEDVRSVLRIVEKALKE
jgi:transcriptional regulator with XRE-family HTH domain